MNGVVHGCFSFSFDFDPVLLIHCFEESSSLLVCRLDPAFTFASRQFRLFLKLFISLACYAFSEIIAFRFSCAYLRLVWRTCLIMRLCSTLFCDGFLISFLSVALFLLPVCFAFVDCFLGCCSFLH